MNRLHRIGLSISQFFNALFGGDEDETISSRLGKLERAGNPCARLVCRIISFVLRDANHCQEAIEEDEGDAAAADTTNTAR